MLSFLVDTGADCSVIRHSVLKNNLQINTRKIFPIQGFSLTEIQTLGSVQTTIFLTPQIAINHEFNIVNSNFLLNFDAILGTDFLYNSRAVIDFEKNGILLCKNVWLNFKIMNLRKNQTHLKMLDETDSTLGDHPTTSSNWRSDPKMILFLELNRLSMVDMESETSEEENFDYYNYLDEFGYPIPMMKNPITKLFVDNEDISPPVSNIMVLNVNSSEMSREEKILSLVKIETSDEAERNAIKKIISSFSDIFHLEGEVLKSSDILYFTIPLKPDTVPINKRQYRMSPAQQTEIKKQVDDLLFNDIIRHSRSSWNAPVLLVPKKSDIPGVKSQRLVIDYRALNSKIIRDCYPLPLISDILDCINGSKFFSIVDMWSGFHQLAVSEACKHKTAFSTSQGHYEFNKLPFGISNSPSTFARAMNFALKPHLDSKICFVYIDDVIILGNSEKEHRENLKAVLNTIRFHKLSLKPSKCIFMAKKVIYLGFQISEDGISPNPEKVEALQKLEVKKTIRGVRSFLGAMSFYRRHTENFAEMAKPLYSLLKTSSKFVWTTDCDLAVANLKKSLIDECLLKSPDFEKAFTLSTDASNHTIAGALTQTSDTGDDVPIGFFSRVLRGPELNYSTIEKEFLAILCSVAHFRCYLIGAEHTTKIITDHRPLKFIFNLKESSSRLIRWALRLEEYNYEIIYRPGIINYVADSLSRVEPHVEVNEVLFSNINAFTRAQARKEKNSQVNEKKTPADITASNPDNSSGTQDIYQPNQVPENVSLVDSLIVEPPSISQNTVDLFPETQTTSDQSPVSLEISRKNCKEPCLNVSDEQEILEIIQLHHDSAIGAHCGVDKTLARIKQYFYWPGMVADIRKYIKTCPKCQKNKSLGVTRAPMVIVKSPTHSFERIAIDIVGPLPVTDRGNKYILTVQDCLTKWIFALPLPNQETETVAKLLVEKVFLIFGNVSGILSDQGSNFMSKLFVAVCKFWKIHKTKCTVYHPESNGSIEKYHYFLKNYLRSFTNKQQSDWDLWCKFAAFSFNVTPHIGSKFSPFELLFGRKPNLPSVITKAPDSSYTYNDYLTELKHKLQTANKIAIENLRLAKIRSKEYYDRSAKKTSYSIGQLVLLKANHNKFGKPLFEKWNGPYLVLEVPSPENVIIKMGNSQKRVHINLIKPYY